MQSFEEAWHTIYRIAEQYKAEGRPILTPGAKNKNWIIELNPTAIVLQSEKNYRGQPGGTPRRVPKDLCRDPWQILISRGRMSRKDMLENVPNEDLYSRTGAAVRGLLSLHPDVGIEKINRETVLIYKGLKN